MQTTPKQGFDDIEIKDPQFIFDAVWSELEKEFEQTQLSFPREILWLSGAPGSGKGTQTPFIVSCRDLYPKPLIVSELLKGGGFEAKVNSGFLVGDKEVTRLLFRRLLNPVYRQGLIVDGYPRSPIQAECLKLLYDKLNELYKQFRHTPYAKRFPKPKFHIVVLFIDEKESVQRQLLRGQKILAHNAEVNESGVGNVLELRETDMSEDVARKRYRVFKETTYEALKSLKKIFEYHYINAKGTLKEVQECILQELRYQSSLELRPSTFDRLSGVPLAKEVGRYARQELVERLDDYEENAQDLFKRVIHFIESELLEVIHRHAISGEAQYSTNHPLFEDPQAICMLIDILSERGFNAIMDIRYYDVPESFDLESKKIVTQKKKSYHIIIKFPRAEIRRGIEGGYV